MNIKFSFASGKDNVVVVKKSNDSDAFKLKQIVRKRITLEIENRIRIDKNTRFRFISKRSLFQKLVNSRRKIFFPFEHLENQIENFDDFDVYDDFELIDVNDNDAFDQFQTRRSRSKTTRTQNLKKYHVDLRRQLKIKKMKKQLSINLVIQRTLLFFFFSHSFNVLFVVFSMFDSQNFYFQNVFSAHDFINSYLDSSNS